MYIWLCSLSNTAGLCLLGGREGGRARQGAGGVVQYHDHVAAVSVKWFLSPTGLLCLACVLLFAVGTVSFTPIPHRASAILSAPIHTRRQAGKCFFYLFWWTMISFQEKEVREKKSADELICLPRRLSALESRQGGRTPRASGFHSTANSKRLTCKCSCTSSEFTLPLDAACC